MIPAIRKRQLSREILPWSPPTLDASRRVVEITAGDSSNRTIELEAGEDCEIRFMEPVTYVPGAYHEAQDAIVTVLGGRHVVSLGAHVAVNGHPETRLTQPASPSATTLSVASTEGFPQQGVLRVAGEGIRYSAKTDTTFIVDQRNAGFFNGVGVPPLALQAGEKVYVAEYARGGLSFRNQTGYIHVEGALIEGPSLLDGIRVRGTKATTATVQNSLIGPVGPSETVTMADGHADCIQTWGSGVKLLRMSHLSLLSGPNGRGFINAANTTGGGAVDRIEMLDTEFIDAYGRRQSLVTNSDAATVWAVGNSWLVTKKTAKEAAPEMEKAFMREWVHPGTQPWIDRRLLGVGYSAPGYAA